MIGQQKKFRAHGVERSGEIVAYMGTGDQVVFWIKTDDGQTHRFVDGPNQVADPLVVARAVLAGRRILGMGVSEQMNILAAAVLEGAAVDQPVVAP
jgi:hypothetical protein